MQTSEPTVSNPKGGKIEIVFEDHSYSVVPGGKTTVPVIMINRGLDEDFFRLSVEGVPSGWIAMSSSLIQMRPDTHQEIQFTIAPPRSPRSTAGRHTLKVRVVSQKSPSQMAEAELTLTLSAFTEFSMELLPQRVVADRKAQVSIINQSNVHSTFTVTCQSQDDGLRFEPANTQQAKISAGEAGTVEFRISAVVRPLLGGEVIYPYTVHVEAAGGQSKKMIGSVASRGRAPLWVLTVLFLMCIATMFTISIFSNRGTPVDASATQTAEFQIAQLVSVTQTAIANQTQAALIGQEDTDGDGLSNDREVALGTNPSSPDSDGDELLDGDEINRSTDPLNTDTDADGLSDGEEVLRQGTDPLNPDTDNDRLLDGDEISRGTNPLNMDSDGDMVNDGDEIDLGLDPTKPDTDNDLRTDGDELASCSDPKNPDTDGDGVIDGQDLDPCDPFNPSLTATAQAGVTPTIEATQPPAELTLTPNANANDAGQPSAAVRLYRVFI